MVETKDKTTKILYNTFIFLIWPLLEARAEICTKIVGYLEYLKTRKKSSEINWPLAQEIKVTNQRMQFCMLFDSDLVCCTFDYYSYIQKLKKNSMPYIPVPVSINWSW